MYVVPINNFFLHSNENIYHNLSRIQIYLSRIFSKNTYQAQEQNTSQYIQNKLFIGQT